MSSSHDHDLPLVVLAMGDPAGIGSELLIRLLTEPDIKDAADILVVGDRRVVALGERQAGLSSRLSGLDGFIETGRALADLGHFDPAKVKVGRSSEAGGDFSLVNFRIALRLGAASIADAVIFTPFNKSSMRLAEADYVDEIDFIRRIIGADKKCVEQSIDHGVTLIDGYPFPITAPAHGTAFDIAGKGIANPGATKRAFEIGVCMARELGDIPFPDRTTRFNAVHAFFRGGRA